MSILFGRWNFNGARVATDYLLTVQAAFAPYGFASRGEYSAAEAHLLHLVAARVQGPQRAQQPLMMSSGSVLLWDGRLDNRGDLAGRLGRGFRWEATDAEIVAAAYEQWGTAALARLVGDWALSVWDPREKTLLLAKDFLGARHLFYSVEENSVTWSSLLDPLVLSAGAPFKLNEEYVAGWFSLFPAAHLTPYAGIHSVPPASYVQVCPHHTTTERYWNFASDMRITYRDDRDYEEHFRTVFGESIRRRLRSDVAVLAELSGGMDSSSIVCMADRLLSRGFSETPRLDTVSYFDDSEPNWNEAPYFAQVERQRGRTGLHIPVRSQTYLLPSFARDYFAATPASGKVTEENPEFLASVKSGLYRVLLTGLGGDEVLGGTPAPTPELADLLLAGRIPSFLRRLVAWALAKRTPVLHLIAETAGSFLPVKFSRKSAPSAPWLNADFARRNSDALQGYDRRFQLFGPRPTFQANLAALHLLRRQVASSGISPQIALEKRYPYLDRDLLEYVYAIPREQILRPNRRRSLMRRALAGIVPQEILERRRKAFISRAPLIAIQQELQPLLKATDGMTSVRLGIVDAPLFREYLSKAAEGRGVSVVALSRTLLVEAWLTHVSPWLMSHHDLTRFQTFPQSISHGKEKAQATPSLS